MLLSREKQACFSKRRGEDTEEAPPANNAATLSSLFTFHSSLVWLFPVLAAFVAYLTNGFTGRLFTPHAYLPFSPGFHPSTVVTLAVVPVIGFLASRYWRLFLRVFIFAYSALLVVSPSLLLLGTSQTLFLVLYTLTIIASQLFFYVFPFAVVDLYWRGAGNSHLGWFVPVSFLLMRASAIYGTGPFMSVPLDNAYAVLLLSLAGIVFLVLMLKPLRTLTDGVRGDVSVTGGAPAQPPTLDDILKKHNLTPRETEVALLMMQEGLISNEIAQRIFRSVATVDSNLTGIYRKFKAKGRTDFMSKVLKEMRGEE
jgi:DNA-binding CsgD family transcriptional regulator